MQAQRLGQVRGQLVGQAQNQKVEIGWEGAEDLPDVAIVRDHVQQVFLNLVLNAVDAMPEGGELQIRASRTQAPAGVAITFADTGVGIPPEELSHIFEAFHSTKKAGVGLGLYVSHTIIQEHGGRIEVQSQEGVGTTFTVWLPKG